MRYVLRHKKTAAAIMFRMAFVIILGCSGIDRKTVNLIGKPAPTFSLPNAGGTTTSLGSYRGNVVFLRFWADWCPYCREEMPVIETLWQEFRRQGLEVLAVNVKQSAKTAKGFMQSLRLTYPSALDSVGSVAGDYGVIGLPTTFIIDREGIVRDKVLGDLKENTIRELIAPYVSLGNSTATDSTGGA